MEPLDLLLSRSSHARLVAPAPSETQLEVMFKAALRAPDHAQLRPWRYRVYSDEALVKLGELFVEGSKCTRPDISDEKCDKLAQKALRAPMVVVASVILKKHSKVPEVEQLLSAGASVQNLLMAAHFQGVGAIWKTGELTYNKSLMDLLGFEQNEQIVGFIYLGTEQGRKKTVRLAEISDFVTRLD